LSDFVEGSPPRSRAGGSQDPAPQGSPEDGALPGGFRNPAAVTGGARGRKAPVWHHGLPTLAVCAAVATAMLFATLVFGLVFLVFDEPSDELSIKDLVVVLAQLALMAASVSLFTLVLGLIFDRLTSRAPAPVRVVAPALSLPLVGVVFLAVNWDKAGVYTLELGILFCLYWAAFLFQELLIRLFRRVWTRARAAVGFTLRAGPRPPTREAGRGAGASAPSKRAGRRARRR